MQMAEPLWPVAPGRHGRRTATGRAPKDHDAQGGSVAYPYPEGHCESGHALVHTQHGPTIGLSQSAVFRIWRAFSLQPRRVETFKLSSDPFFIEKIRDIVGLYLNPPDHALMLCVDEKSQIVRRDKPARNRGG
jgi:hypothetical protein